MMSGDGASGPLATDLAAGAPARWSRLAAVGLILAGVGPALMLLASLVWGLAIEDELPFFAITAVVAFLGAFLVWRFGAWAKWVAAFAALAVAAMLFWTAFGLAEPRSFFDFVPGLLVMPGALLAIVSSIAAFVAGRRGHFSASAVGGERTAIRIVTAVVALLVVLSGILTLASRSTADEAGTDLIVTMAAFEFDESEYVVAGGSRVFVRNTDPFLHTFTVDALGIDETLTPGSEEVIEIPQEPGDYVVYCKPHTFEPEEPAEDDMAARLRVE